ncbi:MAG: helix-turn-helix transcriptional regulator [Gammaproteobacteria bacterium]|nr:helix-turn-helix transcriptional regulator [Gammaproteobacteria bacterium]
MNTLDETPIAIAEELGERLKQARLNADMTQVEVAEQAGISRKAVINAEKGKAQLETLIAIMAALRLTDQLNNFLPVQEISPIQLAKLQGRKRQRASGQKSSPTHEPYEW